MGKEAFILHRNTQRWGREIILVQKDGAALCFVSVENNSQDIAWISNVSVADSHKHRGYGNAILKEALKVARQESQFREVRLWCSPDSWVKEWYERNGFVNTECYEDGLILMTIILENMTQKNTIIHVELAEPYLASYGNQHHYFGSVSAIYEKFSREEIGVQKETVLRHLQKDPEYITPTGVTIRKSTLVRKPNKKTE